MESEHGKEAQEGKSEESQTRETSRTGAQEKKRGEGREKGKGESKKTHESVGEKARGCAHGTEWNGAERAVTADIFWRSIPPRQDRRSVVRRGDLAGRYRPGKPAGGAGRLHRPKRPNSMRSTGAWPLRVGTISDFTNKA